MSKSDPTKEIRRELVAEIDADPGSRADLEARYGQVWDTKQLGQDFEVLGFMAPFCVVRHKLDGKMGSVEFQHMPRFCFSFSEA